MMLLNWINQLPIKQITKLRVAKILIPIIHPGRKVKLVIEMSKAPAMYEAMKNIVAVAKQNKWSYATTYNEYQRLTELEEAKGIQMVGWEQLFRKAWDDPSIDQENKEEMRQII